MVFAVPCLVPIVIILLIIFSQICDFKHGTCKWHHGGGGGGGGAPPGNQSRTGNVLLEVSTYVPIATIDEVFVCATMDWWPPSKCDYGTCAWGNASLLNLDLVNPLLEKALKGLSPLRIRLGGSLQDQVVYNVGSPELPCLPFVYNASNMFGFQGGCLSMQRWTDLFTLFQKTGTVVAFGLNALYNRPKMASGAWGSWDSSNAHNFIKYTIDQGFQVQAWQFGNELSGSGVGTSVTASQYAEDVKVLRNLIDTLYAATSQKPLLIAPDGFFDYGWYNTFLQSTGPGVVDVITRHIYNLGPGVSTDLVQKILNPSYLDMEIHTFQSVNALLKNVANTTGVWVGEAGGAYNSGHHLVTDAFIFSFWYLDQLGMAAQSNNKAYCRQSFIGGNYGLLNTTTYMPNPDYYSALVWNRLMGTKVLATRFKGAPYLRAYAHCQKNTTQGGVSVLLINLSNSTTYTVDVSLTSQSTVQTSSTTTRPEYHLTAPSADLHSQVMLLNGNALGLTSAGDAPTLSPIQADPFTPTSVAPYSIAFVVIPDAAYHLVLQKTGHGGWTMEEFLQPRLGYIAKLGNVEDIGHDSVRDER